MFNLLQSPFEMVRHKQAATRGMEEGRLEVPHLRQPQLRSTRAVQQHALPDREVQEGRLVVPTVPQPQLGEAENAVSSLRLAEAELIHIGRF